MSDLKVSNIIISKSTSTFVDGLAHYNGTFELDGDDTLDYYVVKYSSDEGVTYTDISSSAVFTGESLTYTLATDIEHLLLIIPFATSVNEYISLLPSYDTVPDYATSIENRFDVFDGNNKILVYKPLQNKWTSSYGWMPDCMEYLGKKVFGWKEGSLWLFNENKTSFNVIFGVQYPQRVCLPLNVEGGISVVKDIRNIAIEGNEKIPDYTVLYSELPLLQITDLTSDDWENGEGIITASFFKDRLSGLDGSMTTSMLEGDSVISQTPMCMVEFNVYDSPLNLLFLNIGVLLSTGHNQILK